MTRPTAVSHWRIRIVFPVVSRVRLFAVVPVLAGLFTVLAVALLPGTAEAHATLISSTPQASRAVAQSPDAVTLAFSDTVSIGRGAVTLSGTGGERVNVEQPALDPDGHTVRMRLRAPLPDGTYTVHWQVTADDGDLVRGSFQFGVGAASAVQPGSSDSSSDSGSDSSDTPGLGLVTVLRWLLFCGLAALAGGVVSARLARRYEGDAGRPAPRPWLWQGALVGLVAAGGLAVRLAGGGSVADGLSDPDFGALTEGTAGRLLLVEAGALLVALLAALPSAAPSAALSAALPSAARARRAAARSRSRGGGVSETSAAAAALVVGVAEGLRGHPHEDAGALGVAVTAVHLLAAAVWVGALAYVAATGYVWREHRGAGWLLAWDYARLAGVLLVTVLLTGTVAAIIVLPSPGALVDSGYGWALLGKLALVTAAAVFAVLARRRFAMAPAPEAGVPPSGPARAEAGTLVGVFAATALLVSLAPSVAPAAPTATQQGALPPAVVGPSLSLGTLTGQVSVGMTASTGQVLVELHAPDPDPSDERNETTYQVTATLRSPAPVGGAAKRPAGRPVRLRGCGDGCFTAPVTWPSGTSELSVRVHASPWHAGTASFDVAWPPRVDTRAVAQVLAAMRTAGRFTLRERVTSDTTAAAGVADTFPVTADQFLSSEPYGSGTAPPAAVLSRDTGVTTLALAYPAEGIYVRLRVGPDHRVVEEQITAPNEYIVRDFNYPQ